MSNVMVKQGAMSTRIQRTLCSTALASEVLAQLPPAGVTVLFSSPVIDGLYNVELFLLQNANPKTYFISTRVCILYL